MVAVLTREGNHVAYRIPIVVRKLDDGVFYGRNEDLGIFVQGPSPEYVVNECLHAIKDYLARCPEELESYKDVEVQVLDV